MSRRIARGEGTETALLSHLSVVHRTIRGTAGGFDLSSVLIAAVAVGILASGVVATMWGIIPWTQDSAAKQTLVAARAAQGLALNSEKEYLPTKGLLEKGFIADSSGFAMDIDTKAKCFVAVAASSSGKMFLISNRMSHPMLLTTATLDEIAADPKTCKIAGAVSAADNKAAIGALESLADGRL